MAKRPEFLHLLREILWRPGVVTVLALYGLLQLISNIIAWTLPLKDQEKYQFVQLLNWRVWMVLTPILTLVLIGLIVRATYRVIGKRNAEHEAKINRVEEAHNSEIRELKEQHKSEQSKLIEGHANVELAMMRLRETEVEGLKKNFRLIYEGQLKLEKDNRRRNNTLRSALLHKIREQTSQLEELKKLKLIVNTYHQSEIRIEQSEETFSITAYLRIHLENNAQYPIRVKSVEVAIFRKTKRGIDKKIRKSEALILPIVSNEQLENLEFKAGVITPPSWLIGTIDISPRCGKRLNPNCFLRVTMEALTQPPYTVDLDVNWELARIRANNSQVYLIPRRSALYQAHK